HCGERAESRALPELWDRNWCRACRPWPVARSATAKRVNAPGLGLQTGRQPDDAGEGNPEPFGTMVQLIVQLVQRFVQNQRLEQRVEVAAIGQQVRIREDGPVAAQKRL